jgi:hypothetical protein
VPAAARIIDHSSGRNCLGKTKPDLAKIAAFRIAASFGRRCLFKIRR